MERLYAPWRLHYITGAAEKKPGVTGCIFCDKPAEDVAHDAENYLVSRGPTCFVILNAFPYNSGHLMVVPYRHLSVPASLDATECAEMMMTTARLTEVLNDVYKPDGYNIGMNVGGAAGAGVAAHLHLHIVPRWGGDTNFMPVIGEVKVLPETLPQSYEKIVAAIQAREQTGA